MKYGFLILLFAGVFFLGSKPLEAAKLHFRIDKTAYKTGESGFMTLNVDTEKKDINAIEAVITFDPALVEITQTSVEKSIINFWAQSAFIDNTNGRISLKGVVLNPGFKGNPGRLLGFTFKAKSGGTFKFNVRDFSVLANDGKATALPTQAIAREITIAGPAQTRSGIRITSSSHSDQKKWYSKRTVSLVWTTSEKDIVGAAYAFDKNAKTEPSVPVAPVGSTIERNVGSGVWYAHVRIKHKTKGWLPSEHFKVSIDADPPSATTITVLPRLNESILPSIRASARDALSGVASYEVLANGKSLIKAASITSFKLKSLTVGKNTIEVRVLDNAGNSRSDKISVLYNPLSAKTPAAPKPSTPAKPSVPTAPTAPTAPKPKAPILFD